MKTALLIGRKNGAGLDQDAALVSGVLCAQGWHVRHCGPREWFGLFGKRVDVVIHLERVFPWWRLAGRRHVLIPNQERFPHRHIKRLQKIDHVLCKTAHATAVFSKLHPSVRRIGFTSPDRLLPLVKPDYSRFFHLAGRSTVKGTDAVIEAWRRHPEWPELVLVQHPDNSPAVVPPNVRLISRVVGDQELRSLQALCGVHVCPSLSEGWGHYIVEGMSCRAVVVTTDAPPMNELVTADRGKLVPYENSSPRHLGSDFHVTAEGLAQTVTALLALPAGAKEELGNRARGWFEDNDRVFRATLVDAIEQVIV